MAKSKKTKFVDTSYSEIPIPPLQVRLGGTYKDTVTGLQGVATVRSEYLNGSVRVGVEPKVGKDNKVSIEWFEEGRLQAV